jgi:MFS family permease
MTSGTFFALYATQNLGMQESYLAYFRVLQAGITIILLLVIQHHLNRFKRKSVMLAGVILFVLSHGILLLSPPDNWIFLTPYIVIEACAVALFLPRLDTQAVHCVRPKERARIYGSFDVVSLALAAPFGILAGYLSYYNRRLPFLFNILLFIFMIYFVLFERKANSAV